MSTPDLLMAPIWFAVNGLLFFSAWRIGRILFFHESRPCCVVHATVLSVACIVLVTITLGSAGFLTAHTLLIGVSLVSGTAAVTVAVVARRETTRDGKNAQFAPAPSAFSDNANGGTAVGRLSQHRFWIGAWGGALALYTGHLIEGGLLQFPADWDSLMYHLPLVNHWLSTKTLFVPDCARWAEPANSEVIGLWMVAPFSGDFLIALNNLPAIVILALGTVMLMGTLEAPPVLGHLAGIAAISNYVVIRQALDAKNDVAVAAFFIAAVAYGLRYYRGGRWADMALCGIANGILSGVKYYALGYTALVCLLMLSVTAIRGVRSLGRVLMIGTLCVLLLGGYWYARNAWVTGTPFYPKGISSTSDVLAQDRPEGLWASTLLGNSDPKVSSLASRALWKMTGPGHAAAVFLSPIVVLSLSVVNLFAAGRTTVPHRGVCRLLLAGLIAGAALLLGVTPNTVETTPGSLNMLRLGYAPVRFGLCFLTLAVVGALTLVGDLVYQTANGSQRRPASLGMPMRFTQLLFPVVLVAVFAAQLTTSLVRDLAGNLLIGGIAGVDISLGGFLLAYFMRRSRWLRRTILPISLACASLLLGLLGHHWHDGFAKHFDEWSGTTVFNMLADKSPTEVRVCACCFRYYPLFGSRRQFYVCRPERVESRRKVFEYICQRNVNYLAAMHNSSILPNYGQIEDWAADYPDIFVLADQGHLFTMFTVNRPKLEAMLRTEAPACGQKY